MKWVPVDGLIAVDNGEFYLSPRAVALIFGVPEGQLKEHVKCGGVPPTAGELFNAKLPYIWLQNGRRRIREAFAVVGEEDMAAALVYLARLEGGTS